MIFSPTRIVLGVAIVVSLVFTWYASDGRWRDRVSDRLLYGIPWGTLVIVGINIVFYFGVQGGFRSFDNPVVLPFVSWSYFYPVGMFTSGIAHGSANHIIGNMAGTIVLAPIAEYAWGHHPPETRDDPPGESIEDIDVPRGGGYLDRPWLRAVVIFPGVLLLSAFVTAFSSLGPGLGFSGALYAVIGFAVVTAPLATVVGVVVTGALGQLVTALREPIARAGIESGPPSLPAWAGIAFQAHMLGFLLGVLAGVGLLVARERRPSTERVFLATVVVGLVQGLWLISFPGGSDTFVLYRGAGTVLVLLLSIVVAVAAGGRGRPLPRPLSVLPRAPTRRQLAIVWLGIVSVITALGIVVGIGGAVIADRSFLVVVVALIPVTVLLAAPALPPLIPDRLLASPVSRRGAAVGVVALFAVVIGLVGVPYGFIIVDDAGIDGGESVGVRGYEIAYVENATTGHSIAGDVIDEETLQSDTSGVVVANNEREMWTVGVRPSTLAFQKNASVQVGGVDWRETIDVRRHGWSVVGNASAYVVDLMLDGEHTRSYTSGAVQADLRVDGHRVGVAPDDTGFDIQVTQNGSPVGTTPIPDVNETETVGPLSVTTETHGDGVAVFAESDGTRVRVATRD